MKNGVAWILNRIDAARFTFKDKLRQFLFLIYGKQDEQLFTNLPAILR